MQLYEQLRKFNFLNKTIFNQYFSKYSELDFLKGTKKNIFPVLDCSHLLNNKNLIVAAKSNLPSKKQAQSKQEEKKKEEPDHNDSSPFLCEIT